MLKRYEIWDKTSTVITPIGEVLTPQQWIDRYPVANILTTVCSRGEVKGGFFGVLDQMKHIYADQGADFSNATTDEEILEVIEAFEDAQNAPSDMSTPEERIASALELQNILAMGTVNEDDPDLE